MDHIGRALSLSALLLTGLSAQEPATTGAAVLHGHEARAAQAAQGWQRCLQENADVPSAWASGFEVRHFGFTGDADAAGHSELRHEFDRDLASVVVLWPGRSITVPTRAIMATSLGHLFVSSEPTAPEWRVGLASVSAAGVEVSLSNMMLQTGESGDGTRWQRIDGHHSLVERRLAVRVENRTAGELKGWSFAVGQSRFGWDPAWLPIADDRLVAMAVELDPLAPATAVGEGAGPRILDPHVCLENSETVALLRPEDLAFHDGELVVTLRQEACRPKARIRDQVWTVEALRRLCRFELEARAAGRLDADGDGRGEFGRPEDVVPIEERRYQEVPGGRYLFRGHLFAVYLGADVDAAEQGFVAFAWPATPGSGLDLAFYVDQSGRVHACDVAGADGFCGHDRVPAADAGTEVERGWRPLW